MFAAEIKEELTTHILPFWETLIDLRYGGYTGYMGLDLKRDPEAEKGCILNSRILWFFSSCYRKLKDPAILPYADHAYAFLRDHCLDRENGGIYWSVTYDGQPCDTTKHTYNQAFAIYALSAYYEATGKEEALALARSLYHVIETHMKDDYGYLEAFDVSFHPVSNEKLSENGVLAEKTMNTLLHVFEGYTGLYRASGDAEVGNSLRWILDIFAEHVYNPELGRQEVFFDSTWHSLIDLTSYGHDIETSWLLDRGVEVLGDPVYREKISPITRSLAENVYRRAYTDHSVVNECDRGKVDTTRVWWVQAESIVGFLNAWQKDPSHTEYHEAAENIWQYVKEYLIDRRQGSEWFWAVHEDHTPTDQPIVEPWKCPYHNGRMCLEVMTRLAGEFI